jgi:hypothetical protein
LTVELSAILADGPPPMAGIPVVLRGWVVLACSFS